MDPHGSEYQAAIDGMNDLYGMRSGDHPAVCDDEYGTTVGEELADLVTGRRALDAA